MAFVYNKNNELLEQHNYHDTLQPQDKNHWIKVCLYTLFFFLSKYLHIYINYYYFQVSHSFKDHSKASHLVLQHTGRDTQFWAGNYGTKISGSVVKIMLPIRLKCANFVIV